MKKEYKHPQIFSDILLICQTYYPIHQAFPKTFRFTIGERILSECAECLRAIVLANSVNKTTIEGRFLGASLVTQARACVEVIRGFLLLAWKLRLLSHGALAALSSQLEVVSKQAARWQQWFEKEMLLG